MRAEMIETGGSELWGVVVGNRVTCIWAPPSPLTRFLINATLRTRKRLSWSKGTEMDNQKKVGQPLGPAVILKFRSARFFEAWLRKNHSSSDGLWLQIAKAGAADSTVTYADAVEVALCYGWIDGQKKALDDAYWLQRFTPRRPRSLWSKVNQAKAQALIDAGKMQASGQAEIDRARMDGRWELAYDGARTAAVPPDLQAALNANPKAAVFFCELDSANRYALVWRVQTAKKSETRTRRIETLVAMLARGEKVHS